MSPSQKNLSSIQKVGQAVHSASEIFAVSVQEQAQSTVASLTSAPFSPDSVQMIVQFQTLSRLNQSLVAIEAELQQLYAAASERAGTASDVILLNSITRIKSTANAAAVDVVAKPTHAINKGRKAMRSRRNVAAPARLSANDAKLLAYLRVVLKVGELTTRTCAAMASGSGLPLGSVGISLKKIVASGAVIAAGRGTYQLGTVQVSPVEAAPKQKPPTEPATQNTSSAFSTSTAQAPIPEPQAATV
jgi:hypothetical protein